MSDTPPPEDGPAGERIAKVLARAGVASRREAERLIEQGRISVNGRVLTSPALKVTPADEIRFDDEALAAPPPTRLWRHHKPVGRLTTHADPEGRETVFDHLPEELGRVISVGRLDLNSEGLLLLTNDGALARALELPATGWKRRYRVRAYGDVKDAQLEALKNGITVEGVSYGPIEAQLDRRTGANVWLTMTLREGKNREIRNVMRALGLQVNRLMRTAYGPFQLGSLKEGDTEELELSVLRDQLGRLYPLDEAGYPAGKGAPASRAKRVTKPQASTQSGDALTEKPRRKTGSKSGWAKPKPAKNAAAHKQTPRKPAAKPGKGAGEASRTAKGGQTKAGSKGPGHAHRRRKP
ncbi:MAG: pseudouridine synthase [Pseudomonadota bacterium]